MSFYTFKFDNSCASSFANCLVTVIMFLISWAFTVVSLALASLIYYYVSIRGKAGDWGDGFKSAYFQLALRSLRSLGGLCSLYFFVGPSFILL
jgi:solute carrier family 12 (potassium/chloride transporter), member 4/6